MAGTNQIKLTSVLKSAKPLTADELNIAIEDETLTTLAEFVKTGKAAHRIKNNLIVSYKDSSDDDYSDLHLMSINEDGTFDWFYSDEFLVVLGRNHKPTQRHQPGGVVINNPRPDSKYMIVSNGDGYDPEQPSELPNFGDVSSITMSFSCVGRFFYKGNVDSDNLDVDYRLIGRGIEILKSGNILDWAEDHVKPLRKADRDKLYRAEDNTCRRIIRSQLVPPEPGYALINDSDWHRSATVLLKHGKSTFLFGVDEGSYFGSELAEPVTTLKDAFTSLVPKTLRGKRVIRQGEWFMVKVPFKQVPELHELIAYGHSDGDSSIVLPIEDIDSNFHTLTAFEIRISKDGVFADGPTLTHETHATKDLEGWYRFERNTAKRSVSQDGVD